MTKWVIGNWKMNPDWTAAELLLADLARAYAHAPTPATIGVCPPALWVQAARNVLPADILVGSQDISDKANGAYTGEIAASMIASMGATITIVGHSERRAYHAESDEQVAQKMMQAHAHGVMPIVCVGESLADREAGRHMNVVMSQLQRTIAHLIDGIAMSQALIAYEPVWAIGTGKVPSAADIAEMHSGIRAQLAMQGGALGVLYGGSVKVSNASELVQIDGVDGFLVGGASLTADEFMAIANASLMT